MATIQRPTRELAFAAVDATPLDGTTAGRTYQGVDRLDSASYKLPEDTDAVVITMSGTGSANNTCAFNLYGYGFGPESPAERIFDTVTATLGTAVAGTSQLFVDTFAGTDKHTQTVGIFDSADNTVCKLLIDTSGLEYLYFEPVTFTTLTAVKFFIREVGQK